MGASRCGARELAPAYPSDATMRAAVEQMASRMPRQRKRSRGEDAADEDITTMETVTGKCHEEGAVLSREVCLLLAAEYLMLHMAPGKLRARRYETEESDCHRVPPSGEERRGRPGHGRQRGHGRRGP